MVAVHIRVCLILLFVTSIFISHMTLSIFSFVVLLFQENSLTNLIRHIQIVTLTSLTGL
jgi:hypothetical protein